MKQLRFQPSLMLRFLLTGILVLLGASVQLYAQGDVTGALDNVSNQFGTYVQPVLKICYPIGAIVFIVGGFKFYRKLVNGDSDATMTAVQLGGAALFLFSLPTIVNAFFGL